MKLSVILPTLNRSTLGAALASCRGADEVIVVADGPDAIGAGEVFRRSGHVGRFLALSRRYNDFGSTPRQIALGFVTGDWIAYLDDDDVFVPDWAAIVRQNLGRGVPHFFQVEFADLGTVWRPGQARLFLGNISTCGIVHRNDRQWGLWTPCYHGDYDFAQSTASNYPGVEWVPKVIATAEKHSRGK